MPSLPSFEGRERGKAVRGARNKVRGQGRKVGTEENTPLFNKYLDK